MLSGITVHAYDAKIDGIYYNFNETEKTAEVTYLSAGYSYNDNENAYSGEVIIPSKVKWGKKIYRVTSIGDHAFHNCSDLTSVTIPESVTTIGNCAFSDCSGLTSITIPNSVITIGYYAFYDCTGLKSVTIPESVINIEDFVFYGCI